MAKFSLHQNCLSVTMATVNVKAICCTNTFHGDNPVLQFYTYITTVTCHSFLLGRYLNENIFTFFFIESIYYILYVIYIIYYYIVDHCFTITTVLFTNRFALFQPFDLESAENKSAYFFSQFHRKFMTGKRSTILQKNAYKYFWLKFCLDFFCFV